MAFAKKRLTELETERRRRLLDILPEVLASLEERRKDKNLTGKEIKEIDQAILDGMHFLSRLKAHANMHDCYLGKVVNSPAIGNMYYMIVGSRYLSFFLENDYCVSAEAFRRKEMEVPLVLEEIYKRYRRFDIPADDQNEILPFPSAKADC